MFMTCQQVQAALGKELVARWLPGGLLRALSGDYDAN